MTLDQLLLPAITIVTSGGLGYAIKVVLDHRRGTAQDRGKHDLGLINTLLTKVDKLEASSARERDLCAAEQAHLRHCVAGNGSLVDAMLLTMSLAPDKAVQAVEKIERQRDILRREEHLGRAALTAARAGVRVELEDIEGGGT